MPLTVVESPYREITRPVVDYVKDIRRDSPRELVVVFVPQYVVGHWWENVLHNQSALRLRARLQFQPGVMITTVPWQLESSVGRDDGDGDAARRPGDLRRGLTDDQVDAHALWLTGAATRRATAGRCRGAGLDRHRVRGDRRAGRARRALRRPARGPGRLRPAHPARRAGASSGSPRTGTPASAAPTPIEVLEASPDRVERPCPYSGPGPVRRLRLAARGPGRAAAAQGRRRPRAAGPAGRAARRRRDRGGAARGAAALAVAGAVRRRPVRGAPGCAGTARTTSSSSTTARSPWSRPRGPCWAALARGRAPSTCRSTPPAR